MCDVQTFGTNKLQLLTVGTLLRVVCNIRSSTDAAARSNLRLQLLWKRYVRVEARVRERERRGPHINVVAHPDTSLPLQILLKPQVVIMHSRNPLPLLLTVCDARASALTKLHENSQPVLCVGLCPPAARCLDSAERVVMKCYCGCEPTHRGGRHSVAQQDFKNEEVVCVFC